MMELRRAIFKELLVAVSSLAGACTKDFEPRQQSFPLIETTAVTNIDDQGAQFNALVIKTGTDPVLDFGFKYVERPTTRFKTVTDTFSVSMGGGFANDFSMKVNHNFNVNLNYDVMAFATTAKERVIGNSVIFKSMVTSPIQITSFSPGSVLDGDTLTIYGENFNRYGSDYVFFDSLLLNNVLRYNNKLVTVTVPPVAHAGPVNVTVDAFYSKTNSNQLIVINPSITAFSPTHGPAGTLVTLKGRFSCNLNYNKILFNGIAGTISSSSKGQIAVFVPPGLSGNVSITIDVNGKILTASNTFLIE
jgi:hypothetical protein